MLISLAGARSKVRISAFTYDRGDITELLKLAVVSGASVQILLDEGQVLGGQTRDAPQQALEMLAAGIEVRTLTGRTAAEVYREVGRSVAGHIKGIQHSKTVLVDDYMLVGSCNWTTSSRANFETGVFLKLNAQQAGDAYELFQSRWDQASMVAAEKLRGAADKRVVRSSSVRR
jgi:phosphatidylserine/phosphatidylglycerophosphate/cardiolipin synthase-like enzyme